ncbi:Atypical orf [Ralstonia solanacearum UW551]|uniref:Atypical orf n=1 Tax=Ralstonia solanacearum (strain UW551) TaxID=342110 RepID=A0AB33VCU8_RALSU|nr:Atypical orf [Ralstonia solanacearum UW551]
MCRCASHHHDGSAGGIPAEPFWVWPIRSHSKHLSDGVRWASN